MIALPLQCESLPIVDSRRNIDCHFAGMAHAALAVAAGTGRVDYLAGTAAPLAGPGRLNHPKGGPALYPNLTCSFTVWAGLRAGTLGCTGAAAVRTLLQPLDGNLLGPPP